MTTIAIHRTQDGELTSADSATLAITDASGATVLAATAVTPSSAGVYSHTITTLTAGTYTATWTFVVADRPNDTISRVFQVESPVSMTRGITLAQIERAVAARLGPYRPLVAKIGSGVLSLLVAKLKSSVDTGDYEDLYLLRRGRNSSDALIAGFNADDRVRSVASFAYATGSLVPDREWNVAPAENERVELHYLEPDDELREAVLEGLRRCYFEDTVEITATTYLREVNLTELVPWLTQPQQVRRVMYGRYAYNPIPAQWWEVFQKGANVWIRTAIPNVGTVRISALRSHFTFVNEETQLAGPNHDDDVLFVEREYAARAGHVSAWMLFPSKLSPVAAQGLAIPMKQAADAFTLASMSHVKREPETVQHRFGQDDIIDWLQVGNA